MLQAAKDQLAEIIETFNVKVTVDDVFARCSKCNSGTYLLVPSSVMSALCSKDASPTGDTWVECPGGSINLTTCLTATGVSVQVANVHQSVLQNTETFYVCSQCGKCYWEGSHYGRILSGRLKNIVEGAELPECDDGKGVGDCT